MRVQQGACSGTGSGRLLCRDAVWFGGCVVVQVLDPVVGDEHAVAEVAADSGWLVPLWVDDEGHAGLEWVVVGGDDAVAAHSGHGDGVSERGAERPDRGRV